jgi:hypothetical protein
VPIADSPQNGSLPQRTKGKNLRLPADLSSNQVQKQLGLPLATGVSAPYHHIGSDAWPAEFWVACRETTECQIDNALVHIDDALVRIQADIGAAL